jgi:hypothetical protein
MRSRNFAVLAGSIFALVVTTTGGCSSTNALVDALNADSGIGAKPDGGNEDEDSGDPLVGDDSGTTKDTGTTLTDSSIGLKDGSIVVIPDSGIDGSKPKVDASALADGGVCPGVAPTFTDLEGAGGWNPPGAVQIGACSQANITQFHNNFATANTYNDLKTGLPASCSACIFSTETSANWSFVVTDATGTNGFFNYGACYARAQFGSNACGKAVQYSEFCINSSCAECATDTANSACTQGTQAQQACSANFAGQIQAGCGTNQTQLQALDTSCETAVKSVNVLCGTGP